MKTDGSKTHKNYGKDYPILKQIKKYLRARKRIDAIKGFLSAPPCLLYI